MPNKRSRCRDAYRIYCPYCELRLWRLNGPKHRLFYTGPDEISKNMNIPHGKATFSATKGPYVHEYCWLEEFFCSNHGNLWLRVRRSRDGSVNHSIARPEDWHRTTGTVSSE
jgi:hypothetical protein